MQKEENS